MSYIIVCLNSLMKLFFALVILKSSRTIALTIDLKISLVTDLIFGKRKRCKKIFWNALQETKLIFDIQSYNGKGTFIQHWVFLYPMLYCKNQDVNVYKND